MFPFPFPFRLPAPWAFSRPLAPTGLQWSVEEVAKQAHSLSQLITIGGDQMVSGRAKCLLAATANVMVSNVGWKHHLSGKHRDLALSSVTDAFLAPQPRN